MSRFRPSLALSLALIPGHAFAHGEEVLLFPFGTLIAIGAVIVLGLLCKVRYLAVLGAGLWALAASLALAFIPGNYFPSAMQHADWGYFVSGFVPATAVGALAVWRFRRAGKTAR